MKAIFGKCILCGWTMFHWVKQIVSRGRDTGYDLYRCGTCEKIGSARPREQ